MTVEDICKHYNYPIKPLEKGQRIFFVDSQNRIWGEMTPRTPRKLKKRLKKLGKYVLRHFKGFDIQCLTLPYDK